jgi:hypothetical protein
MEVGEEQMMRMLFPVLTLPQDVFIVSGSKNVGYDCMGAFVETWRLRCWNMPHVISFTCPLTPCLGRFTFTLSNGVL